MSQQLPTGAIRFQQVEAHGGDHYRLFILSSLALAGLAGFLLGIHIPMGRLLDWPSEGRRPDIVAVHGQVQMLGFAGLFVLGMSLRLMPRFAGQHLRFEGLVLPVWGGMVGALATRAFVMLWLPERPQETVMIGTQFVMLLAAFGYFVIAFGTLVLDQERLDGSGWFFLVGTAFFLLQALLGTFIAVKESGDPTRVFSYVPNMALLYLQLTGFIVAFVGGVSSRALPTMSGLPRPEIGAKRTAVALAFSVTLLSAPLVWLEYHGHSPGVARLSDVGLVGLGFCLASIVWLSGIFRRAAERVRPASQPHMRLVRLAFAWLAFAAGLAVYFGARAFVDGGLPSFYELDALRHAIALGTVTTLIFGMAMMIVPEFAGERQRPHQQALISTTLLALLATAASLRVATGLLGTHIDADLRNGMAATAGVLAEAALLYFATKFVRLLRAQKRFGVPVLTA